MSLDLEQLQIKINDLQTKTQALADAKSGKIATKPVIAVYGLMNAGKSFLLNVLTDNLEKEYFVTGDQRVTQSTKTLEKDGCIYLDTPGLNANDENDEAQAQTGIENADVVLFVHQPQGALSKAEAAFLKALKNRFGHTAKDNIIVIITKIDKEDDESKIALIHAEVERQCEEIVGDKLQIFDISSVRYRKGRRENKATLERVSHVNELREHVQKVASQTTNALAARSQNLHQQIDDLIQQIDAEHNSVNQQWYAAQNNLLNSFKPFNDLMVSVRQFVQTSASNFRNI